MKLLNLFGLSALLVMGSCSTDETVTEYGGTGTGTGTETTTLGNIPLTVGSNWSYATTFDDQTGNHKLTVEKTEDLAGKTYSKFITDATLPQGFYSNSIRNNYIREEANKYYLKGDLSMLSFTDMFDNLALAVDDFVLLDENAANGTILDTESYEETVNTGANAGNLDIVVNLTIESKLVNSHDVFETYKDVKQVEFTTSVSAYYPTTIAGVVIKIPIMAEQEVVNSNLYFAKEIGMIKSNTAYQYELADLSSLGIDIPTSGSYTSSQTLETYEIK